MSRFSRKYESRSRSVKFLIVTEGEKTEPNYFNSLKRELVEQGVIIECSGTGFNSLALVEEAIRLRDDMYKTGDFNILEGDEAWVVLDKDAHEHFDESVKLAREKEIKVAYSNESFELWYLLHFNYDDTPYPRSEYRTKLKDKKRLGEYEKNAEDIYEKIRDKEADAIRNAGKLLDSHDPSFLASRKNPSTTVHLLIQRLRKVAEGT